MSQALCLRVPDVIIFSSTLRVTISTTHVEKHAWSNQGVMGPFSAKPK